MGFADILILLSVGFIAGALGGLLGIGGSIIMIPVTVFLLHWPFHLAQAVAMTVNPAVALSATVKQQKNKSISWGTTKFVLPISLICICVAAWLSNQVQSYWLEFCFGVFLIWVLWDQLRSIAGKKEIEVVQSSTTISRCSITGGITGTTAGMLGIGGGLIQVPLLNRLCGLPMRIAIGTSSSIMFITAIFGATVKDLSLSQCVDENGVSLGLDAINALLYAVWLFPSAIVGGWVGAWLTTKLPVKLIRTVFALLVAVASFKMIAGAYPSIF